MLLRRDFAIWPVLFIISLFFISKTLWEKFPRPSQVHREDLGQAPILASPAPSISQELPHGVGRLPALGWNSWNAFDVNITEDLFLTAAEKFIELGLKDAGYEYVNIDDGWSIKHHRDPKTDRILPDVKKFPDGIKGTADKVHAMGLKLGIYSSAGTKTCAGYPASIGYELIDAQTWVEWGVDYLKYDNCYVPDELRDPCRSCVLNGEFDPLEQPATINSCGDVTLTCPPDYDWTSSPTAKRYGVMRDALLAQNRTILYSLCEWGNAHVESWGNATAQSWRSTGDINPSWRSIVDIMNQNIAHLPYVNFYGHADPDMLEIGNGKLTYAESKTHFAMWALMKSPLLIGTPLDKLSPKLVDLLKNRYLLAFNQDAVVGEPAMPYKWVADADSTRDADTPAEFWSGLSSDGVMVAMFNPAKTKQFKIAWWAEVPGLDAGKSYEVVDVWNDVSLGCQTSGLAAQIPAHDTAVILVKDTCGKSTAAASIATVDPEGVVYSAP